MFDFTGGATYVGSSSDAPFSNIDLLESLETNVILCGSSGMETIEVRRSSDWQEKSLPDVTLSSGNGAKKIKAMNALGGFAVVGSSAIEIFDENYTRQSTVNPLGIGVSTIHYLSFLAGNESYIIIGTQTSGKMLFNYNYQMDKIAQNLDTEDSNLELNISKIGISNDNKILVALGEASKLYIFKEDDSLSTDSPDRSQNVQDVNEVSGFVE